MAKYHLKYDQSFDKSLKDGPESCSFLKLQMVVKYRLSLQATKSSVECLMARTVQLHVVQFRLETDSRGHRVSGSYLTEV